MTRFNRAAVLGMGAFGVALTKLVSTKAEQVMFWGRDQATCDLINETRHHKNRLPQIVLPSNVLATTDLSAALKHADCIILAVPMPALASVLMQIKPLIDDNTILVSTAKGILPHTLFLPCDLIEQILTKANARRACYLSGPSFAIELAMDLPTALTVASHDEQAAIYVQTNLSSKQCRLYRTDDVIGVAVGGALKNVIAIAAGVCAGLGLGKNALAALITRGLLEMARLAQSLHGQAATLSGLSGAGDLILSCTDSLSRNHRLGTLLADGMPLADALTTINSVVEGAETTKAIPALEQKYRIELPICHAVYQLLYEGKAAPTVIATLLERELKKEGL